MGHLSSSAGGFTTPLDGNESQLLATTWIEWGHRLKKSLAPQCRLWDFFWLSFFLNVQNFQNSLKTRALAGIISGMRKAITVSADRLGKDGQVKRWTWGEIIVSAVDDRVVIQSDANWACDQFSVDANGARELAEAISEAIACAEANAGTQVGKKS